MTFEEFILLHESDDPAALLLARHRFPDIDIDLAATTIECRRRLRRKVPAWYAIPSLRYPYRLAAEQCSSEETARLKAMVALSIAAEGCCFQTASASLRPQSVASQPSLPSYAAEGGHGFENNTFLRYSEGGHGFATDTSFRNSEGSATHSGDSSSEKATFEDGLAFSGPASSESPVFEDRQAVLGDSSSNRGIFEDRSWRIADLTGGMGVDSWAFSQVFGEVLYNEMQEGLAGATKENFARLGVTNVQFRCRELMAGNLLEILDGFKPDVIYMDPARRAGDGRKVFRLADCQPDVLTLLPELTAACPNLLLKLSPMADITQLSRELPGLKAVIVVGADGECKELLLHVRRDYTGPYTLTVVENGAALVFDPATRLQSEVSGRAISCKREAENGPFAEKSHRVCSQTHAEPGFHPNAQDAAGRLLFEPGKALAKTGRFAEIGSRFGLSPIGASTHLYLADSIPDELRPFGKVFAIEEVLPLNNETFRSLKKRIPAAEITARNLPLTSDALRKKLGIASGGTQHLFGVRSDASGNLLLVTTPLSSSAF